MTIQLLSDLHARLNLPHAPIQPERIPPLSRAGVAPRRSALATHLASRRALLSGLAGGALSPLGPPEPTHRDPVLMLVHRITQGFSLFEYQRAQALGFEGYLEEQLDHLAIDDSEMDLLLPRFLVLERSPKEIYDTYATEPSVAQQAFKVALLARATVSRRQLFERMCEFWIDHFNIDHNKGLEWALLPEHERTVIRPHALGTFPELLSACAFSGAMLYYLDNWLNVRAAPQENYARELLELHTLSVHGGYNESDVDEVAKCFTGWTLNGDASSPDWLRGTFDASEHSRGQKLVLGHAIGGVPAVGKPGESVARNEAQEVLDILAMHPSTARFLAKKLIRRFLTPTPPQELVEQVAQTYQATGGDIKAMLRVILTRENFANNLELYRPKYRRPFHFMASVMRALDGSVRRPQSPILPYLVEMGQVPYDFPFPTGYAEDFPAWGGSLLPRWEFSATLLRPSVSIVGVRLIDPLELQDRLEVHGPADRPGLAERIDERVLGRTLSRAEVDILQGFIDGYPVAFDVSALYDCLVLAVSLPGYQWC